MTTIFSNVNILIINNLNKLFIEDLTFLDLTFAHMNHWRSLQKRSLIIYRFDVEFQSSLTTLSSTELAWNMDLRSESSIVSELQT